MTYKFRLKDGTRKKELKALAGNCNYVWNFSNEVIRRRWKECLLRVQKAKKSIRFRTGKKNLGWIPFNGQTCKFHGGYIDSNGYRFRLWQHRKIPDGFQIKTGS